MDYRFDAFLGKSSELQKWRLTLPAAVVFRLNGELGMVPVTSALARECAARGGTDPILNWGRHASAGSTLAYVNLAHLDDNQSGGWGVVWSKGRELDSPGVVIPMLIFLKDIAAIDFVPDEIDLGCYRGEHAAEQWAAAAFIDRPEGATGIRYYINLHSNGKNAAIYRIYGYIKKIERYGLFGDYWDWHTARWVMAEDIVRRYWSGFDADVEPASEAEVIHLIRTLRR